MNLALLGDMAEKQQELDHFERGNDHVRSGDYDIAIAEYSNAIELNPAHAESYANRGGAYLAQGEYTRAAADYDFAIKLDPTLAEAYYNRANVWRAAGEI